MSQTDNLPVDAEGPVHIGFLIMPDYSMITFANAVAVLRMANRQSGRELYRWTSVTMDGRPVASSDGLELNPGSSIEELGPVSLLFVCGGYEIEKQSSKPVLEMLRAQAANNVPLGALCTGTYILAAAGLLEGYRCTVHWENLSGLREQFPGLQLTSNLFVIDRDRFTCSGGVSSIDLMLNLIASIHGNQLVQQISEQFSHERVRTSTDAQRVPLQHLLGANQPKLVDAVSMMEANIEEPLSLDDIAGYLSISRRQLERLFQKHLNYAPSRYYMELRLSRARQLLLQTNLPIIDVAISCGFSAAPHFSKCYSEQYGKPPRSERLGLH